MRTAVSRRELLRHVLRLAGGTYFAPLLAACDDTDDSAPAPSHASGIEDSDLPFAVWRAVRDAVRTSPDHLIERARRLVDAGDADAIVRFVRDEIRIYPGRLGDNGDPVAAVRWGTRAALRCGAGTPREKAELLAELLEATGRQARLMLDPTPLTADDGARVLNRRYARRFDPEVNAEEIQTWQELRSLEGDAPMLTIDADGEAGSELARRIFELLPADQVAARARGFDLRFIRLPVVQFDDEGVVRVANPSLPDDEAATPDVPAALGELTQDADGMLQVTVGMSYATTNTPNDRRALVERTWFADQLVGRQIVAKLMPGLQLPELALSAFNDVRAFVPALWVQGPDIDDETAAELSELADPVTIEGLRVELGDEAVTVGGIELAPEGRARVDEVERLEVRVEASHFPEMRAVVTALDGAGRPVEGLSAGDFEIMDEATPVGFSMGSNRPSPRITILVDQSGSMPAEWRGDQAQQLARQLEEHIRARFPAAVVDHQQTDSRLWHWLVVAAGRDSTLTVYATDGHVDDQLTPEAARALAQGPHTIILSVYSELRAIFDELAEVTGGVVIPIEDIEQAQAAVLGNLDGIEVPPYRFRFAAAGDEPTQRTVRVSTSDGRVEASAPYEAPPVEDRPVPDQIAGLYLTVTVGRADGALERTVTRNLGGYDERYGFRDVERADVRDAHAAAFGTYVLAVEAADPPLSVWLDDLAGDQLTMEPLIRAIRGEGSSELFDAMERSPRSVPPEVRALTGPLPGIEGSDAGLVYQDGLRIVLHSVVPAFGRDHMLRRVDVLPTAGFATTHADGVEAFRATLEATARIAVGEGVLFPRSTLSLLDGHDLVLAGTAQDMALPPDDDGAYTRWEYLLRHEATGPPGYRLAPEGGSPLATWNVDPRTGDLLGFLDDAGGGGSAERASVGSSRSSTGS